MKEITLNCFRNFRCKSGECKNNCCIGWKIEIDKQTLKAYKKTKGEFGKKLKQGIDKKRKVFKKDSCGRCVFLNKDNLCEIILNTGENNLCQVCKVHPRYKCFLSNRAEYGIGLSCEEGVNLLFSYPDNIEEVVVVDDGKGEDFTEFERFALDFRKKLIDVINDKSTDFNAKIKNVLDLINLKERDFFCTDYKKTFLSLETLCEDWKKILNDTNFKDKFDFDKSCDLKNERLITYFIYRHVLTAIDGLDLKTKTLFAVLSVYIINGLYKGVNGLRYEDICRMYSAEIEYSSDNLNTVFDLLDGVFIKSTIGDRI